MITVVIEHGAIRVDDGGQPARKKRWTLGILAILVVVGAVIGTCLVHDAKTLTEGELRSEVARELPAGSTQSEIFAFLERKGAQHTGEVRQVEDWWCCYLKDADVAEGTSAIVAIMHDTGINVGLKLYFLLRDDGTLDRFLVYQFDEFPIF